MNVSLQIVCLLDGRTVKKPLLVALVLIDKANHLCFIMKEVRPDESIISPKSNNPQPVRRFHLSKIRQNLSRCCTHVDANRRAKELHQMVQHIAGIRDERSILQQRMNFVEGQNIIRCLFRRFTRKSIKNRMGTFALLTQ